MIWMWLLAGVLSWGLTGLLRRYALERSLLDLPNERSSHAVAMPRGGGLAIVLTCLAGVLFAGWAGMIALNVVWALLGAGALVALVGWLDDHGHVAARWRLLAHFLGAMWVLWWLGGLPPLLLLFGAVIDLGWLGHGVGVLYLVWLLNLYNFMDGIDGIAGIEAVTVCFGGGVLYIFSPMANQEWIVPILLLATVLGFLVWNFPKARIFMGDAGSGFLGMMLGVLSLQAGWVAPELFWGWLILLGVFIVDATVTLFRRVQRGDKFYEAHRSHAYQYASRYYGSHKKVSLAVGFINSLWLLPVAILVGLGVLDGVIGMVLAYAPLILLAFRYKAGARELQVG
ncbi:glycosyl transferase [Candidatus Tenderia electrophaga]|uniref:Glycosyl transferase n=1 Tax=Candidatus Tenderia electrophaga TaxID=1748243 RepID=A0A0S2TI18_9GAMM|nr:glycosyl transferase [Candidatus Tenderia electrophaga]